MHIRFVSITVAAVLALSSVSVQAAPTPVNQGLQALDNTVKIDGRSFLTFEKRHHHGKDGEDADDEKDEEEDDEKEEEADEEESEEGEDEHHRHHARSDQAVAITNGEGVTAHQYKARDVVKRHGQHGENEPDEDDNEPDENEPDENEPDEDENEPDENEPDEDENEPDENEPDENEPDENENEPDEDEHRRHGHGHDSI